MRNLFEPEAVQEVSQAHSARQNHRPTYASCPDRRGTGARIASAVTVRA